nr:hypothetical protein [Pseudomonadota bacterium]
LPADGGAAGARLYKPAPAIRILAPAFTGTPMPKDEPMAANPPAGAYIDYTLGKAPVGSVEIAIADARGQPVARFSSADTPPPLDLAKIGAAPEWIVRPTPPLATPGQHRFVWDLHYSPPAALADDPRESGVWAPPGRYTVTLAVDGRTYRAPLDIAADPRVSATSAAYARQFALARTIEAERVRARVALTPLKADPARKADAEALSAISERLDKLAAAVGGADGAPSPDAESGYRLASAALDAALGAAR